jgi:NADH:ubiquinone oxidoreductase, NADH-binding (51 kD) subunit
MTMRIFVPRDAGAVAVGADEVATALSGRRQSRYRRRDRQDGIARALLAGADGRGRDLAGPRRVRPGDCGRCANGVRRDDRRRSAPVEARPRRRNPWLKRQTRLTFARCGVIDPRSVRDYRAHDGYKGLERALTLTPDEILADVTASGLRGRAAPVSRPASSGRRWR